MRSRLTRLHGTPTPQPPRTTAPNSRHQPGPIRDCRANPPLLRLRQPDRALSARGPPTHCPAPRRTGHRRYPRGLPLAPQRRHRPPQRRRQPVVPHPTPARLPPPNGLVAVPASPGRSPSPARPAHPPPHRHRPVHPRAPPAHATVHHPCPPGRTRPAEPLPGQHATRRHPLHRTASSSPAVRPTHPGRRLPGRHLAPSARRAPDQPRPVSAPHGRLRPRPTRPGPATTLARSTLPGPRSRPRRTRPHRMAGLRSPPARRPHPHPASTPSRRPCQGT